MNPILSQLLAQQLNGGQARDGDTAVDPLTLLAAEGQSDPMLALMAAIMRQNQAESRQETQPTHKQKLAQARKVIRILRRNLADAEAMLHYIGEVFGACPVCWGQNKHCVNCQGNGQPGSAEPAEQELLAWAVPALEKMDLQVVRKAKRRANLAGS